eukprot:CAMPEP_0180525532 /NCGR_PEP_ID=MMETSP1036_2-20121128/59213_1 /TAXON_ID=632150 /ORGANISM="Azadinium spinosum, Strain 3D9" /LENGTH=44 /DNA_ID= /DNA_START= /DNA_END= /DNA_ORIENTATION=
MSAQGNQKGAAKRTVMAPQNNAKKSSIMKSQPGRTRRKAVTTPN